MFKDLNIVIFKSIFIKISLYTKSNSVYKEYKLFNIMQIN